MTGSQSTWPVDTNPNRWNLQAKLISVTCVREVLRAVTCWPGTWDSTRGSSPTPAEFVVRSSVDPTIWAHIRGPILVKNHTNVHLVLTVRVGGTWLQGTWEPTVDTSFKTQRTHQQLFRFWRKERWACSEQCLIPHFNSSNLVKSFHHLTFHTI